MKISYKAVERGQPGVSGGGDKKFYASIVRGRPVPMRTIIEEIAELNVTNTAVVLANLESFLQLAGRYLMRGKQIDLGQLGTFTPSVQSRGGRNARGSRPVQHQASESELPAECVSTG